MTVYTQEAHAAETGHYKDYFLTIKEHNSVNFFFLKKKLLFSWGQMVIDSVATYRSVEDRAAAAGKWLALESDFGGLPGPLVVADIGDQASRAYGSFPGG